jgi:hypothetical protein
VASWVDVPVAGLTRFCRRLGLSTAWQLVPAGHEAAARADPAGRGLIALIRSTERQRDLHGRAAERVRNGASPDWETGPAQVVAAFGEWVAGAILARVVGDDRVGDSDGAAALVVDPSAGTIAGRAGSWQGVVAR